MRYTLRFIPEVAEDAIAGYTWYEGKSQGLGEEFLCIFYACASEIPRGPSAFPKIHREIRRCLLRRFPYAIYFMAANDQIIVLGLFHCARDPGTIGKKLRYRGEPESP